MLITQICEITLIPVKFCIGDSIRCHIVRVKFYLNWCRFTLVIAKRLGGSLFCGHSIDRQYAAVAAVIVDLDFWFC